MTRPQILLAVVVVLAALSVVAVLNVSIFVIQPIGAVPDGRTIILKRVGKLRFIDSADAICEREMGGVSLLCRGGILAAVVKNSDIYMRLPYSRWLYLWSTGGKEYDR
jgi:hypothetical protein